MNDKQQLAAMGEHMAEHMAGQAEQPLCMAKRIEELEAQVRVMAGLLREATSWMDDHPAMPDSSAMHAALVGKVPESFAPEGWQLVPCIPTPEMCDAYHRADNDWEDGWAWDDNGNRHWPPVYQWAAMLAAAPKPEAK